MRSVAGAISAAVGHAFASSLPFPPISIPYLEIKVVQKKAGLHLLLLLAVR